MSYDIYICDDSGKTLHAESPHVLTGGTYAMGGTNELWLNITYNYAPIFRRVLGESGIRSIYGKLVSDTLPTLREAASKLEGAPYRDYWAPTDGNAKKALLDLVALGEMAPTGVWQGD